MDLIPIKRHPVEIQNRSSLQDYGGIPADQAARGRALCRRSIALQPRTGIFLAVFQILYRLYPVVLCAVTGVLDGSFFLVGYAVRFLLLLLLPLLHPRLL